MENKSNNMETTKKVSSFVKEVLARLKGDTETVVAAKNERKANAALEGQINSLKSKLVDDEDKVTEAEEALGNAIYPVELISDASTYVSRIKDAQEKLNNAQENLSDTETSLNYFQNLIKTKF